MDGLDLFNDDTCPSGHISRPTHVNVSQSCFNSLNILLKLNYIVQVWGLLELNCIMSVRRIPLLAGIPLCKSRELSRRGYSMIQLCSIHHDIPVTLHTPGAYGQWSMMEDDSIIVIDYVMLWSDYQWLSWLLLLLLLLMIMIDWFMTIIDGGFGWW